MTEREALNIAIDYMNERLEEHDAKFQRHPVAEAERNNILADIEAVKEALAQQNQFNPDWDVMAVMVEEQQRMAKRIAELEAQPEQPKYRRGNRLVCLETDEYCVIHISGTDRQWVKFPDSYIGVYTNEQVAELFELLPKESEPWEKFCDSNCVWTDHHPDCKLAQRKPLTDEEIWVLTSEYNDYDQHGEYFEAIFIGKPTAKQIQKHCLVGEKDAAHILAGGGRVKYEDQWYNLRKEKAAHGIYAPTERKGEA